MSLANTMENGALEEATMKRVMWRVMPLIMLCYFVAYLDRTNVGFAALQMNLSLIHIYPKTAKTIVRREVTRVLTPGTAVDAALEASQSQWLASVAAAGKDATASVGVAALDLSTGEFRATEFAGAAAWALALDELARMRPAEILFARGSGFGATTQSVRQGVLSPAPDEKTVMNGSPGDSDGVPAVSYTHLLSEWTARSILPAAKASSISLMKMPVPLGERPSGAMNVGSCRRSPAVRMTSISTVWPLERSSAAT